MAVTKTHPIKSTLKAAIDYILNPEKTDGKLLASSFGCGLETADIEFAWTREAAGDRGTHLGRHLIQSFAVGETTPEEAHKIGMELAGAVLGGKYEFVLTTHVDKDHLHNHLIFNAVSFVDYKKYHSKRVCSPLTFFSEKSMLYFFAVLSKALILLSVISMLETPAFCFISCRMVCFPCAGLLFCSKNFWIAFCNACSVSRAAPFPTLTYRAIVFWVTSSCKVSTPFPVKCGYAHSPPYKS